MKLLPPLFTLIGATIGVGILALPYAFVRSGIVIGVWHVLLAFVLTLTLNLMYVQVLLHVKGRKQLAGYAGTYFGKRGKIIAAVSLLIGAYGACVAYIIQGGIFLNLLFPDLPAFYFSLIFFMIIASILLTELRFFSYVQSFMVGTLLILITVIGALGFSYVQPANFGVHGSTLTDFLLPYGVLLFAFAGYSVIPELGEITRYDGKILKRAVLIGTSIVAVVYVLFPVIIVGISGDATSEDAISGLEPILGITTTKVVAAVALVAITTACISLSRVARDLYEADFKLSKSLSWFLAIYPPLLIFLLGKVSFVRILEISGGITVGLAGVLIGAMYLKLSRANNKRLFVWLVMIVFSFGVLYELLRALRL